VFWPLDGDGWFTHGGTMRRAPTIAPNIAAPAALIGDPARAAILTALADGTARPAGELAEIAGLSRPAASAHLTRLVAGGLLAVEQEGRHRYFRLAGTHVAAVLEELARLAGPPAPLATPRTPAARGLRFARSCYDHLAGELGVALAAALAAEGALRAEEDKVPGSKRLRVTTRGQARFATTFGIDTAALTPGRHGIACRCLDWTERRWHLGGPLGGWMLERMRLMGWVVRDENSRAIQLTRPGAAALEREFGVRISAAVAASPPAP
jgi:DNA-binding transcriptional ArsR family regulator